VSENEASATHTCNSAHQFLIYSTLVLVDTENTMKIHCIILYHIVL